MNLFINYYKMNDNEFNKTAHINISPEKSNLIKLESMKKIHKK